ncbi:MAG: radical SAM protein [Clostridia bacterium]|nr:radical SAM protein [Clostridia bacterium]
MKHYNVPIFVPHEGCPHDCVFCNQKKITGHNQVMSLSQMKFEIEMILNELEKTPDREVEIAFFGGSFTGIPFQEQEQYLQLAYEYVEKGLIDGIRLSTRPDYIDEKILKQLKKYGVSTIELGVQSMDTQVVELSKRGHTLQAVYTSVALIKKFGFDFGLQMMVGLPGDTLERAIHTANEIVKLKPSQVRIYPTIVLKETELEEMYLSGIYTPLTIEEAVEWCVELTRIFEANQIQIIRLGLQSTDLLSTEAVVAGPYHPAFRQLVNSRRWLNLILSEIVNDYSNIEIHVHPKLYSDVLGQKKSNLIELQKKYPQTSFTMIQSKAQLKTIELYLDGGKRILSLQK